MQSHGHTQLVTLKLSPKDEELSHSALNLKQPEKIPCEDEVLMQEDAGPACERRPESDGS